MGVWSKNGEKSGWIGDKEWTYGPETLIDIRGELLNEYSVLYLESIALLAVELWDYVFSPHRISSGIWTFGVCFLGTSGAIATKF